MHFAKHISCVVLFFLSIAPTFAQTVWNPPPGFEAFAEPGSGTHSPAVVRNAPPVTNIYEVEACLKTKVALDRFQIPMRLREALILLREELNRQGKDLPFVVHEEWFKAENPDAPPTFDTEVKFPEFPPRMEVKELLHIMLVQVETQNATYTVRPDHVVITTFEETHPNSQLGHNVPTMIRTQVPRADMLQEIYEQTGVAVVIDPRYAHRLRSKASVAFINGVSVGAALKVLCNTVGLSVIVVDNMIYITTPENARLLHWEVQYQNPAYLNQLGGYHWYPIIAGPQV